ncbi:MAG: polysaccharide deacetylase family protein [Rhizobacter sp.]|nr:polysaccharide deacetylase family protein [Rhizobacter sp.]
MSRTSSPLRWHAPVLVKATLACHLAAGVAVLAEPASWPWALAAVVLNHAVLTAAGLWPRSSWLGSNLQRLPEAAVQRREVALTLDDGPDPQVTPAVLDLLDAHGARATFFCIAEQAARHPQLCREIVARGHSVQNHSHRHVHTFSFSGPQAFAREIDRAQETLAQLTGQRPLYFRAPAGFRNLFLAPVLDERRLQLVSWTRRGYDTVRRDPKRVLQRLTRGLAAGDILLLHDRGSATAASGHPVVLEVLPALLHRLHDEGLRAVTLPQAMQPARAESTT